MKRTELKRKTPMNRGKGFKFSIELKAKPPSKGGKSIRTYTSFKPGNGKLPKSKPMRQRAANRPAVPKWEKLHVLAVKSQRCVCCGRHGPSDAHHCFHGRYGSRRQPNRDCIPLCKLCHQDGPEAIHKIKRTWGEKHGPDHSFIPQVMVAIYGIEAPSDEQMAAHWRSHPWWQLAEIEYLAPD